MAAVGPKKTPAQEKAERLAKKERYAAYKADKAKFDRIAKRRSCIRCGGRGKIDTRISIKVSRKMGVLPHSSWLCSACGSLLHSFMSEIRDAEFEAARPAREADQVRRKAELDATLAQRRGLLDADRAAKGLPPLASPAKSPKKPPARKRKPPESGNQ